MNENIFQWIATPAVLLNMLVYCGALIGGASFRTIRSLEAKDRIVKVSWVEWVKNQSAAIPIGLIAMFAIPARYDVKPAEMMALMIVIGLFSAEAYDWVQNKFFPEKIEEKILKEVQKLGKKE